MIDILNRWTQAVLYSSATATEIAQAVSEAAKSGADLSGANLSGANLSGADLSGADLFRADLYGANLSRADLSRADLSRANLFRANLSGANLSGANLSGADLFRADLYGANLSRADLSCADLSRANGVEAWRSTQLQMLVDQPGKIRAYKLVTANGVGPYNGGITYEKGESYEVLDACTDTSEHCAAGINVATMDWCLREWQKGYRILVVEFEAKDIAAIPLATNGKFRLFRCTVVGEKDLQSLGVAGVE